MLKHQNAKIDTRYFDKKHTAALIGINLYGVLFLYLFIHFLECSAKYA